MRSLRVSLNNLLRTSCEFVPIITILRSLFKRLRSTVYVGSKIWLLILPYGYFKFLWKLDKRIWRYIKINITSEISSAIFVIFCRIFNRNCWKLDVYNFLRLKALSDIGDGSFYLFF